MSARLTGLGIPLATFCLVMAGWQVVTMAFHIPPFLLPSPVLVWQAAIRLGPSLLTNGEATFITVIAGFALSVLLAVPLGIIISLSRLVSRALYPWLVFVHAVPIVAIAPIIVMVFGMEIGSRLVIVLLIAFFPIVVATTTGLLQTPDEFLELARACQATRLEEIRTIRLPYAVPYIFGGLRIGMTAAVTGAVVAEFVSSDAGLGYMIVHATTNFQMPAAMASVIVIALISIFLYQMVGVAQRVLFPRITVPTNAG